MEKTLQEICVFRLVANKDEETLKNGGDCITLNPAEAPCFKCDGSGEYAKSIDCDNYTPKRVK